jgi:hypothetical protein
MDELFSPAVIAALMKAREIFAAAFVFAAGEKKRGIPA